MIDFSSTANEHERVDPLMVSRAGVAQIDNFSLTKSANRVDTLCSGGTYESCPETRANDLGT